MKQFYSYRDSAECFRQGGHYTEKGRTEAEINYGLADTLNAQIAVVIIPAVRDLLKNVDNQKWRMLTD